MAFPPSNAARNRRHGLAQARRSFEILAHATSLRAAEKGLANERSPVARFVAAAVGEADRSEGLATEGVGMGASVNLTVPIKYSLR
jgi:hypothetical protein